MGVTPVLYYPAPDPPVLYYPAPDPPVLYYPAPAPPAPLPVPVPLPDHHLSMKGAPSPVRRWVNKEDRRPRIESLWRRVEKDPRAN